MRYSVQLPSLTVPSYLPRPTPVARQRLSPGLILDLRASRKKRRRITPDATVFQAVMGGVAAGGGMISGRCFVPPRPSTTSTGDRESRCMAQESNWACACSICLTMYGVSPRTWSHARGVTQFGSASLGMTISLRYPPDVLGRNPGTIRNPFSFFLLSTFSIQILPPR